MKPIYRINKRLIVLIMLFIPLLNISAMGNKSCFMCHNNSKIKPRTERGQALKLHISTEKYAQSNHAKFKCMMCHKTEKKQDFFKIPHPLKNLGSENCSMCHRTYKEPFSKSIHEAHQPNAFQCSSCHDPHLAMDSKESLPHTTRLEISNQSCVGCHSETVDSADNIRTIKTVEEAHQSIPYNDLHLEANRCVDCHTPAGDKSNHQIVAKSETIDCVTCHNSNSLLLTKADKEKTPTSNSAVLTETTVDIAYFPFNYTYLPGASRIPILDKLLQIIMFTVLAAVFLHGMVRIATSRRLDKGPFSIKQEYFYGLSVRIWHWANALLFLILILTGFNIHFTNQKGSLIDFAEAVRLHQVCGGILVVVYLYYLISSLINGNIKNYLISPKGLFTRIMQQSRYYLHGIFTGADKPFHPTKVDKFNELQRLSYLGVIFALFPMLVLSGIGLLFPKTLPEMIFGLNGPWFVAMLHFTAAGLLTIFIVIHVYQITTGDKVSFLLRAMISGVHRSLKYEKQNK